jgi:hypothetical protein
MSGNQFQKLAAFAAAQKVKEGGALVMPPYTAFKEFDSGQCVSVDGVDMQSIAIWHSSDSDFYHQEAVGEEWRYEYKGSIRIDNYGVWGTRTPILHPAVAGIDATEAGYDDAYLRALQQVDVLTYGTRDDSKMIIRRMVERYSKLRYSPVRLLVRAVVLWAIASRNEMAEDAERTVYSAHDLPQPTRLSDAGGYSVIARTQHTSPGDVIFVNCDSEADLSSVEVARALTAQRCPVRTRMSVQQLWPSLSSPRVVYMCTASAGMGTASFDAAAVEQFLYTFCSQFDCFDLLQTAVALVQTYLVRPIDAGILGGSSKIKIGLPASDLRVGALGPLLAGVSAEGMRTDRYLMPTWTEFAYGAAVRGCLVSASYHESLIKYDQAHPVAYTYASRVAKGRTRLLANYSASRSMIDQHVGEILEAAGWDCWPGELRNVAPVGYHGFEKELFNGSKVPWWTNVLGHMTEKGLPLVKDWARPAYFKEFVTPGRWYTANMLEGSTQGQFTSAVRWLHATASYVYNADIFTLRTVPIARSSTSRFMDVLKAQIVMNGRQKAAMCVQFNEKANEGSRVLRELGRANLAVIKQLKADVRPPAGDIGMDLITDMPSGGPRMPGPDRSPPATPSGEGDDDLYHDAPDEPPAPEQERSEPESQPEYQDTIDWDGVAARLQALGITSSPEVYRTALNRSREPGSQHEAVANALEQLDVKQVQAMSGKEKMESARAVMFAMTRLGPHLAADSRQFGGVQSEMVKIVMDDMYKGRKLTAHTQEELDEQATNALQEGNAAAGGVPEGHDDPEGPVETVQDFGPEPLGQGYPPELRRAEPVTAQSLMEPIGFLPPERSDPFTIQFEQPDRAVAHQLESASSQVLQQ